MSLFFSLRYCKNAGFGVVYKYKFKGNDTMTKVYIIRHAEAEGNIYRRMCGQYNGKLTKLGVKQLDSLEKRFEGEQIDRIYYSICTKTIYLILKIYLFILFSQTGFKFRHLHIDSLNLCSSLMNFYRCYLYVETISYTYFTITIK